MTPFLPAWEGCPNVVSVTGVDPCSLLELLVGHAALFLLDFGIVVWPLLAHTWQGRRLIKNDGHWNLPHMVSYGTLMHYLLP